MEQKVICGDNIEVLKTFADNSIDACVTDSPYGLGREPNAVEVLQSWITTGYHEVKGAGIMLKQWDAFVPQPIFWKEVYRVLKPGGHVLSFFGCRTYDWGVMAMRLAGFEIRDRIQWCFDDSEYRDTFIESLTDEQKKMLSQILRNGDSEVFWLQAQGFPKGLDISKAIDEYYGAERKVIGKYVPPNGKEWNLRQDIDPSGEHIGGTFTASGTRTLDVTEPATEDARRWFEWKTQIKPSNEPIVLAMKPISEKTIVENVLKWGVGAINIGACRVATDEVITNHSRSAESAISKGIYGDSTKQETHQTEGQRLGRYPSNVILDEKSGQILDEQTGILKSGAMKKPYEYKNTGFSLGAPSGQTKQIHEASEGGGSRFFYCPKISRAERNFGLTDMENKHVSVKPISLMRYLIKLVCPKDGLLIDPHNGSGSTGIACKLEGINYIGIEQNIEDCKISEARIAAWEPEKEEKNETDNQLKMF